MKVIITGATGMVGRGVLKECLDNHEVTSVLIINRKPAGIKHSKLREIVHEDFFDLSKIKKNLKGNDACFFCLGISSFRQSESDYTRITYDLTMNFAKVLLNKNRNMTFCYVSGTATDSSEKGKSMWARVKGKTENDLFDLGFKTAFAFRPAYIRVEKGQPSNSVIYRIILGVTRLFDPIVKSIFPRYTTSTEDIAKAMIEVSRNGFKEQHIESATINALAKID